MWIGAIQDAGVRAVLTDAGRTLTVIRGAMSKAWRIRRLRRTPRPSEIRPDAADSLLWLPTVTSALRRRLQEVDASWVTDAGEVHLAAPWGFITVSPSAAAEVEDNSDVTAVLQSLGAQAVLQFMLESPVPAAQRRIAVAAGISQPRVSQILRQFRTEGLAVRVAAGWQVPDPATAFDTWLKAALPPVAVTTTWYSLAPPQTQIGTLRRLADDEGAELRLCGDWAADLLAPWRPPRLITVHTDRSLDLDSADFVPAPVGDATLVLHIGAVRPGWRADPDVRAAMAPGDVPHPLAPVTEIAREIMAVAGTDADQAVAELRSIWLRARAAVAARWA